MRTTIVIGFILLGSLQVWAADSDLFPLQQLELGMTATDMLKAYPNVKTGFVKNNATGQWTNGLALCEIANGVFWDAALILIQEGKVQSWSYVRTKDFERASANVGAIHKALVRSLGGTPEQKVACLLGKQKIRRAPMFIWKFGNALAVFTHSPVKDFKSGERFTCQLAVFPNDETLQRFIDVAKDKNDNDSELFKEVTSDPAKADK